MRALEICVNRALSLPKGTRGSQGVREARQEVDLRGVLESHGDYPGKNGQEGWRSKAGSPVRRGLRESSQGLSFLICKLGVTGPHRKVVVRIEGMEVWQVPHAW